jgi:subtilisin family serine protease
VFLSERTGKGIRIAVIDSGVHAAHPHVGGVAGGIGIRSDGAVVEDYIDRLGHGTAVAAAIREKAPQAELFIVKVFWHAMATNIDCLIHALRAAAAERATVINLSLGTAEVGHRRRLESAVAEARYAGSIVVSANDDNGRVWLPGSLADVVGVRADWTCDPHGYTVSAVDGRPVLATSPYPRDIPGVPRERNLKGISFAVANASGFVARALEASPAPDVAHVFRTLNEAACVAPSA